MLQCILVARILQCTDLEIIKLMWQLFEFDLHLMLKNYVEAHIFKINHGIIETQLLLKVRHKYSKRHQICNMILHKMVLKFLSMRVTIANIWTL